MKLRLILLLFLILPNVFLCCHLPKREKQTKPTEIKTQNKIETVHYFDRLFPKNGIFIRPDSLSDGVWIAFCETNTSQIGLKLNYKNGKRNGETISYWPNGNIQQKGFYHDGCLVGLNEWWYENGIKESESNCEIDNIKLQHSQCQIINFWSKTGEQLIKNGTGKYISYHDNDTLQVRGEYFDGMRVGKWTWYYKNGFIQLLEFYDKDKHIGNFTAYYSNGQKRIQGTYSQDKQVGEWTHWYQDGKKEEYENRVNGKRDGEYKSWYKNGQIYVSGQYRIGKEEGVWKYFNEKSKLCKVEIYKNGKLIKTMNYSSNVTHNKMTNQFNFI